jgi:hypothetical protein
MDEISKRYWEQDKIASIELYIAEVDEQTADPGMSF